MKITCWSAALAAMMMAVAGSLIGSSQAGAAPSAMQLSQVTLVAPSGWEKKPGSLVFRLRRKSALVRFLAIDEVPASGVAVKETMRQMQRAFASADRIVDSVRSGDWKGHQATYLLWHGKTKSGVPIRGEQRLAAVKNSVVSVLWYAPTTEWNQARRDMPPILDRIGLR